MHFTTFSPTDNLCIEGTPTKNWDILNTSKTSESANYFILISDNYLIMFFFYVFRMYLCVTWMLFVCHLRLIRMSFLCHSYAICVSSCGTCMTFVCDTYVSHMSFISFSYFIRIYSYTIE